MDMIEINRALCDECATCVGVCPANALVMEPALCADSRTCTSCGRCVKICPFGALVLVGSQRGPAVDRERGERGDKHNDRT